MNNLIVNLVFGILTSIFLILIVILISNAIKIAKFNDLSVKRIKEENRLKLVYIKTEIQTKFIPLVPLPNLLPSATLNQKLFPVFIPMVIGRKTSEKLN